MEAHPSKILMTADTVGGVWTYSLELVRALAPYGIKVSMATMGGPVNDQQRREADQLANLTLYESDFKLEWMDDPWHDVEKAGEWLLQLCDEVQPDLIHLNGMTHGNLNWGKPVLAVVHSCVLSWWRAVRYEEAPQSWQLYGDKVRQGLKAADIVVTPTQALMQQVEALYGPFQKKSVIYNGRDPHLFRSDQKEPFIFTMGRVWDEAKNIAMLARIAGELRWPVYVAGDGIHPATGQAIELDNMHFLGRLAPEEVSQWLSRASIFALPAKYEPFGLAILEAALSGCALVVGETRSLTEVWGDAAAYIDPSDSDELCETINWLIGDEAARTDLARRAAERAQIYTAERMAKDYISLYNQLLNANVAAVGALD